jgi:hypothetical protein
LENLNHVIHFTNFWHTSKHQYSVYSTNGRAILLKRGKVYFAGFEGYYSEEWTFNEWKTFDGPEIVREADGSIKAIGFPYYNCDY